VHFTFVRLGCPLSVFNVDFLCWFFILASSTPPGFLVPVAVLILSRDPIPSSFFCTAGFSCADVCAPTSISASPRSDSVVFVGLVFASARLLCSFFTAPVWFSSSAPARFSRRKPIGAVAKERTLDLWSTLSRTRAGGFWISTSACFGFSYLRFLFTVSIYPLPQCFAVW
jgi:hypothetical protein